MKTVTLSMGTSHIEKDPDTGEKKEVEDVIKLPMEIKITEFRTFVFDAKTQVVVGDDKQTVPLSRVLMLQYIHQTWPNATIVKEEKQGDRFIVTMELETDALE